MAAGTGFPPFKSRFPAIAARSSRVQSGLWPPAIRLNIAPPGWEKTFGALQGAFNHEHGWSRPDDPARARVQQPGSRAYVEAAQRTLAQLEADTWGLVFHKIKGERFVVVPDGVLDRPHWRVDDRPALKLSNE